MMNLCDKYDIIIEGGQSNAEGSGIGPVNKFEEFTPSPRILYLTPDCKVTVDDKGLHIEYPSNDLKIEIAQERVIDGKTYGDQIHFCREALYELGHRYYDAFSEIV